MSSDNGIYILKSKGPEWRVAHCQAIDNIFYENPSGNDDVLLSYFGDSPVFTTPFDAQKFAESLYDELINDDFGICEYGIVPLYLNRSFPKPNSNDLIIIEKLWWTNPGDDILKIHGTNNYMVIDRYAMSLQGLERKKVEILIERKIITQEEGEDLVRLWEKENQ